MTEEKPKTFAEILEENTLRTEKITLEGQEYAFRVCKKEMNSKFPLFISASLPNNNFFISEEIPEKFYKPFFTHQLFCKPELGEDDCCRIAFEKEMDVVVPEEQKEYAEIRRQFFVNLRDYNLTLPQTEQRIKLIKQVERNIRDLDELFLI